MNKKWLRRHVRGLPHDVRRILLNDQLRKSEPTLRSAIRRHPRLNSLRSTLIDLLRDSGRKREALLLWHSTVARTSSNPAPYFQRARWAMDSRDFVEAEKYLRLCISRDTGYFAETAHFWRAEALNRLGRLTEALHELTFVNDEYEEYWFLDYKKWSKTELLAAISASSSSPD